MKNNFSDLEKEVVAELEPKEQIIRKFKVEVVEPSAKANRTLFISLTSFGRFVMNGNVSMETIRQLSDLADTLHESLRDAQKEYVYQA